MRDAGTSTETGRYALCANLVWERSPKSGEIVPGRYCVNRLGAVSAVDCPVYQGLSCCLFEDRANDASPTPATDDELEEIRAGFAADYLRWPYWRRIDLLRRPEPPPEPENPLPDIEEPEEEEDLSEIVRIETARKKEEALREKYPGQRRSEDRLRKRVPPEPGSGDAVPHADVVPAVEAAPEVDAVPEVDVAPEVEAERRSPDRRPRRRRPGPDRKAKAPEKGKAPEKREPDAAGTGEKESRERPAEGSGERRRPRRRRRGGRGSRRRRSGGDKGGPTGDAGKGDGS